MKITQLLVYAVMFCMGAAATYGYHNYFDKEEPATAYVAPTMNSEVIKNMVNNYKQNQLGVINKTLQMQDAHAASFSLEALKNFIVSIEQETKKVKPETSEKDLGVRIYYAAYPNSEYMSGMNVSSTYAKRHTLIMIPTLKTTIDGKTMDYDFNPLDATTFDVATRFMNKKQFFQPNNGSSVMALNHGQLTPPDQPTATLYP